MFAYCTAVVVSHTSDVIIPMIDYLQVRWTTQPADDVVSEQVPRLVMLSFVTAV